MVTGSDQLYLYEWKILVHLVVSLSYSLNHEKTYFF